MKFNVKRHAVVQPQDQSIRLIPLTQGKNATVDASDYGWLSQWNWHVTHPRDDKWYAIRSGGERCIMMHRAIITTDAPEIDHLDGDGLNNRRANLRPCTVSENQRNRAGSTLSKSGHRGVYWSEHRQRWLVSAQIGAFKSFDDAKAMAEKFYNLLDKGFFVL